MADGYEAAWAGTALYDGAPEGRLLVRGADRTTWLQGLLTNDVAALPPGGGCYAAYLTPQGRMITDLVVLALDDAYLLDLPAVARDAVKARLELFVITEAVEISDASDTLLRVTLLGPRSAETLTSALGLDERTSARIRDLPEHYHVTVPLDRREPTAGAPDTDARLIVAATAAAGRGFDLYVPSRSRAALAERLQTAGAVPIDEAVWNVLRLESGRPAFGLDMDQDTIPLEAGIEDRAISETKGCYVGQEVIVRVRDRGHGRVARRLVGLAGRAPDPGSAAAIARGDALMVDGREIGRVTSSAFSPRAARTIALGYVHRDFVSEGTSVTARHEDESIPLTVSSTPFVRQA